MLKTVLFASAILSSGFYGCQNSNDQKKGENMSDPAIKEVRVFEDIPYRLGQSKSWVLDLAMPVDDSNSLRPAIVIVHGGGWRAGTKEDFVYRSMMVTYALKGYVTVSVEYCLTQEAPVEIGPQRPEMAKPEWWPIGYISENEIPPMLFIQGGADPIVKPETVDNFVAMIKQAGHTDIEYIRMDELGHDVSYSTGLNVTAPAIEKFFERTLKSVTH